ncbi:conserved Plasmodium protein, unknown function [Plasmodium gallinaceum]|uniref:TRIP4/RQT4 C2HC5-type zinc finger domain-containing protein n=1 Tax=Plasmodium gallinaceum TaxID=5849 RepID=A0A1J1GS04_PLAGA|nr:conserved Plasmodium protein, unknown function [Plasmodium gallinaceum]CRG95084.1 conserved Plasmodium protein, unknown function [Plasmodium gallinaceum]
MLTMCDNDKYANYLRNKIVKYFNLKNNELEINYIKSILNSRSYDLFDSIFLLNQAFYEKNKNLKYSLNDVKKFTYDLINNKKKFNFSDKISDSNINIVNFNNNNNTDKSINSYFENIFKNDKISIIKDKKKYDIDNERKFINAELKEVKLEKNKYKENNSIKCKENNDNIEDNKYYDDFIKIKSKEITENKNETKKNKHNEKINSSIVLKEKELDNFKMDSSNNVEMKTNELTNLKNDEIEEKREKDYFSFFNIKENDYSLKTIIDLMENDNIKSNKKSNQQMKNKKEKKKNIQICICNGQNHKIYANCLICGKIYCTKIKYKNCIYCGNQIYESSIFDKIYLCNEDMDNVVKKVVSTVKNSDPFIYKLYFDSNNSNLKKAFNLRNKMLNNSLNEEQTKIIDDSIDWFEDDIKNEFNNSEIHFSCYDDEIKNEIINKYYEIFGKRFNDINIDIDLVNMEIKENVDYFKIKEFNDYLNEKEKEYRNNIEENKKEHNKNVNTVSNYLSEKEKKNLSYINDIKNIFFKEKISKSDISSKKNKEKDSVEKKKIDKKKYKYNMSLIDEEYEDSI